MASSRLGVAAGSCVGPGPGAARANGPGMERAPDVLRGCNGSAGAWPAVLAVRSYRAVRLAARQEWGRVAGSGTFGSCAKSGKMKWYLIDMGHRIR